MTHDLPCWRGEQQICPASDLRDFAVNSVRKRGTMGLILLIIVILLLLGALPTWPYSTGWGYYPSGGLGLILLILLVLLLMGRL